TRRPLPVSQRFKSDRAEAGRSRSGLSGRVSDPSTPSIETAERVAFPRRGNMGRTGWRIARRERSVADVAGVQSAGLVDVVGSLADGTAVRKDGELVSLGLEAQQKAVVTHLAQRFELFRHALEVEPRRGAMRHLDGVAAAQAGRVRALLPLQPLE